LSSNLILTTRKCVLLATRGHFWSRDKDGGHTIVSTLDKQETMLHCTWTLWLYVLSNELLPVKVLHCRTRDFQPFLLLWPGSDDLHIQTNLTPSRYTGWAKINFLCQGFILHVWIIYR